MLDLSTKMDDDNGQWCCHTCQGIGRALARAASPFSTVPLLGATGRKESVVNVASVKGLGQATKV
jgi:hypothetical protein